ASASLRSFFAARLLRNGLTNSAAISRGVWPWPASQRAQWCAAPQASSPNTHGGSCTAQAANASRRNTRVNTVLPERSAPHTAITSFARSTPTVVISFMTSPLVQIDGQHLNLGTSMPCGSTASSRGSPFYSLNLDASPAALARRPLGVG